MLTWRTTSLNENVCPRVLFTVVPVDYKKDLLLAFGEYVEACEGTNNTSRARSSACIALHPASNAAGVSESIYGHNAHRYQKVSGVSHRTLELYLAVRGRK
jgi:hypothetical protein